MIKATFLFSLGGHSGGNSRAVGSTKMCLWLSLVWLRGKKWCCDSEGGIPCE